MRVGAVRDLAARPRAQAVAILVASWALGLIYAFPGLMSIDSVDQLLEARAHVYTDHHPPAMQALWRLIDMIVPGPTGMLVLQTAAFVAGTYLLLRRVLSPRRAALVTSAIFLFPPVLCPLSVIWKDCLMAGALVLAISAVLAERRAWRVAGLVLMLVASAVRYNGLAATFAPVILLFTWRDGMRAAKRYALAAAAWVAVTLAAFAIDAALTDVHMHLWHSSLAVSDIAGTLAGVDGTLPDSELRDLLDGTQLTVDHDIHAAIRTLYVPYDYSALIAGPGHLWDLPVFGQTPAPASQRDAIARAFWDVVTSHPAAYLRHRLDVMLATLAITSQHGTALVTHDAQNATYMRKVDLEPSSNGLQRVLERTFKRIAKRTPLFHPWLYCVLALVLLALVRTRLELALLLSGVGLEASLFLLSPGPDFRYSHWLVVCVLIVGVMVVARTVGSRAHRRR
jgi:hypothetical protein